MQRSSAGEQFKEQYDTIKSDTNNSFYYDAFGVVGTVYLIYLVATSGVVQQVMTHH
jgi:hypothetical protein